MNRQSFPGARWWKFDFHTHTPASDDFSDKDQMEPELWLKKFMEEKIDCVAITDHNSGGWIDCLKQKLWELEENENKPDWYHPLYLFPGVEISTYDDVHLLAIFRCDKDESHIDRLLGAVGYSGTKGKSDGVTNKNIVEVVGEIIKNDGIAIPAHVDKGKGLFQLPGKRLQEVLREKGIYAMELRDDGYEKPQLYKDEKTQWTEVVGSDSHGFDDGEFGTFTWIKMDNPPSIEGLRLALIDGAASVKRDMNVNPNHHAECFMEEIEISNAKYIGRTKPLKCQFSPFLSTIIGGRGSGKSTLNEDNDILSVLETGNEKWRVLHDKLSELSKEAESIINEWHVQKSEGDWMQTLKEDMAQYEQLSSELEQQGIDPDKYPLLLEKQKSIQKELVLIDEHRLLHQELNGKKRSVFKQIEENRKGLTEKRRDFLLRVLQNNEFVNIEIIPFGDNWDSIEKEIRNILNCGERFGRDINNLKEIYHRNGDNRIEVLKEKIRLIRNGEETPEDNRFANYLESLPPESMINLALWFPGDNLKVTFSTDGGNPQQIEQGSPGQKTAALLAFILSYGNEPLLLDQPEDDLDNKLIYNLIVKQLRETKNKRQVIVVTHNANVVVNGDAEMVLPLEIAGGETRVRQAASIQESEVRQAICNILEGGQQAFEQRYKRIHLET